MINHLELTLVDLATH